MAFAGINHLAILVAAALAWLASAVWYMSLCKLYAAALGKTPEQMAVERKKPGRFCRSSMPSSPTSSSPGCSPACSVISARGR